MIATRLCQLISQTGFIEPLEGRTREIAKSVDEDLDREYFNPSPEKKYNRARMSICFVAAYLALV